MIKSNVLGTVLYSENYNNNNSSNNNTSSESDRIRNNNNNKHQGGAFLDMGQVNPNYTYNPLTSTCVQKCP